MDKDSEPSVKKETSSTAPSVDDEPRSQSEDSNTEVLSKKEANVDEVAEAADDDDDEDVDDEDDDDEDEDDDDEDDEEEDVRSRKRRRGNQFLDVEAEVDDDEEEDEDDEEAEIFRNEFIADDQANDEEGGLPRQDDRLHRKLDRSREKLDEQDAQALADEFRARYGRSSSSRYMGSTQNVSQRLLLPSVDDPLIWGIRVRPGAEKELVKQIFARLMTLRNKVEVYSVFQRDSFVGYIYVEARRLDAVNEILKGLPGVYNNMNKVLVPIEEYPDLMKPSKSTDVQLKPGSYVRVKSGKYKGDLGIVDNLAENDLEVRVKLVPRLDYGRSSSQTVIDSTSGSETGTKRGRQPGFASSKFRPPQRLFSEIEAGQYDPEHLSSARREKGYYVYRNEEYINGFLYKDIKIQHLQIENIKPSLHELTLFNSGSSSDGIDLASIAASLKEGNEGSIVFQPDDSVDIVSGEQNGMKGRVIAAPQSKIVRVSLEGNEDVEVNGTIVEVPVSSLRKKFSLGDHVSILHGSHQDESGLIVKIQNNQVTLVSDQTNKDITVFPNFLVKSSRTANSSSQVGRFELHQLVQLSSQNVGIILKAEKEIFTVLCVDGRVVTVEPSSIQSAVEINRATEKTTDRHGLEIKVGDIVKEIIGERREGNILHVYRSTLFMKSKTVLENTGIFVVNATDVQTISNKGSLAAFKTPDLNKMNPNRAMPPPVAPSANSFVGRDVTLSQHVSVRRGPYKGKKGIVKSANGEVARVEMHNPAKIVPIGKSDLLFEARPGQFIAYEQFLENYRGRRPNSGSGFPQQQQQHHNNNNGGSQYGSTPGGRSSHNNNGGNRSAWGSGGSGGPGGSGKTPAWSSGGKTPAWSSGGKTPAWSSGGKTPAWGSERTPAWGSDNSSRTPAWGAGGKTPVWGSDNRTPAWGGSKTPSGADSGRTPAWGGSKTPAWSASSGGRSAWNPDSMADTTSRPWDTVEGHAGWGSTPGNVAPTPGAWDAPTPANNGTTFNDNDDEDGGEARTP